MIRKNLLLFFLAINIMLPVFFSFAAALSSKEAEESEYAVAPLNCPEEESKEDSSSYEEEKKLNHIACNFSPLILTFKIPIYPFNQTKLLSGISLLPYNPPELS